MENPILCFDRDKTVDVNPSNNLKPVPLCWVQYFAHIEKIDVWATGNQQLQIEAGIPTPYEARQILLNNNYKVPFSSAGGHKYRRDRLNIINQLYNKIYQEPNFIVVDDENLNEFCDNHKNWSWYNSEQFVENIDSINIPRPEQHKVSGEPYYETDKFGTYSDLIEELENKVK